MECDTRACSATDLGFLLGKDGITDLLVVVQEMQYWKVLGTVSTFVVTCNVSLPLQLDNLACMLLQAQTFFFFFFSLVTISPYIFREAT